MIYDEDPDVRGDMRCFLEGAGEVVVEAGSVDEALLLLAADHIKAVVSVVEPDDLHGRDLIMTVRRRYPDKKVILMSENLAWGSKLPDGVIVLSTPVSHQLLRDVVAVEG